MFLDVIHFNKILLTPTIQAWIAQLVALRLGTTEIVGSNPGKGKDSFKQIWIWVLTKKAPILIHDVDASPYADGYKDHVGRATCWIL